MKVCKFCGNVTSNFSTVCNACGGNEFSYKCDNCDTVFDEGKYCPKCGVKAGQKPRHCPYCNRDYYTNACPDCGYMHTTGRRGGENPVTEEEEQRNRNIGKMLLWGIGWICMFPVPLSILIARAKRFGKGLKIVLLFLVWSLLLFFILREYYGG